MLTLEDDEVAASLNPTDQSRNWPTELRTEKGQEVERNEIRKEKMCYRYWFN